MVLSMTLARGGLDDTLQQLMGVMRERPADGRSVSPGRCFGVAQGRTCSRSDEAHEMGKAQAKVGAEERRPRDSF